MSDTNALMESIVSLEAQLVALYIEKETASLNGHQEAVESLEAQLVSLYSEKEGESIESLKAALESLESQLCALYAKDEDDDGNAEHNALNNLEQQAIALTDEKMLLEREVHDLVSEIERLKVKARSMGAALFEAALFSSPGRSH